MPAEPTFNSPGFCLASAINSFTEPTGSEAVTASTLGPLPSIATGPTEQLQPITSTPYAIRSLNALNASNLLSVLPVANLPTNVTLLTSNQIFSGSNTFNGVVNANNGNNSFSGTFSGTVSVDRTVLLFGLAVSTLAGLLFGLAPAHQLARLNVHDDLKVGVIWPFAGHT